MPQWDRQVHRRLSVRSIEGPVFRGVLINIHSHVESGLDGFHRALEMHVHTIAGAANDREAVRFRKRNHVVITLLTWTKPLRELLHCYEVLV